MKPTKRKAFNFLRSYFDVLNEIPEDKDKLDFLLAIINKQFLDEDPNELSFVAKLSYESQRHSIESSVNGYKDRMKTDVLGNPLIGSIEHPPKGGSQPPAKQGKEKGKEKEKGKVEEDVFYTIDKLIEIYLSNEKLCEAFISNKENKVVNKEHLEKRLNEFSINLSELGRHSETWVEFTTYFRNWNKKTAGYKKESSNPLKDVTF